MGALAGQLAVCFVTVRGKLGSGDWISYTKPQASEAVYVPRE